MVFGKTVQNSGRFGPNRPQLKLATDYSRQFKTVCNKFRTVFCPKFFVVAA
jgi:hypothetical protein